MEEAPQVRKSIQKAYWYDKTNRGHVDNLYIILVCLFVALIFTSVVIPLVFSYNTYLEEKTLNPTRFYILGFIVLSIFWGYRIYVCIYFRYYRVVKRIEYTSKARSDEIFQVQTCVSNKTLEEVIRDKRIKWVSVESFITYSCDAKNKAFAEAFFDKMTIEKTEEQNIISEIGKSIKKPKLSQKLNERFNVSWRNYIDTIILSVFLNVLFITFIASSTDILKYRCGVGALIVIVIYAYINTKKTNRYFRLVEIIERRERYVNKQYRVQSYLSNKTIEKIRTKEGIKWRPYFMYELSLDASIYEVKTFFNRETTEKKVVNEVL